MLSTLSSNCVASIQGGTCEGKRRSGKWQCDGSGKPTATSDGFEFVKSVEEWA